jgi:HPt (histidine-containing phosphotransfer) domain-containing protein
MSQKDTNDVTFSMPGGEAPRTAHARPIDLAHLARQTMGDRALEQEVISLFIQQAGHVGEEIAHAAPDECRQLAHRLIGSARGVGAFAIADCAAEIHTRPDDHMAKRRLSHLIDEVRDFVAAIGR